ADLAARYGLGAAAVALFLGGLKPRKNLPLLLETWARVAARVPDARLVVGGGGPLRPELERHARRLGVSGRVVFTGYVPEADKVDLLNLADVFVFPSAMEGFGLAVGEAMSCGLPVVASDRGSIPELVVDGEGGRRRHPHGQGGRRAAGALHGQEPALHPSQAPRGHAVARLVRRAPAALRRRARRRVRQRRPHAGGRRPLPPRLRARLRPAPAR